MKYRHIHACTHLLYCPIKLSPPTQVWLDSWHDHNSVTRSVPNKKIADVSHLFFLGWRCATNILDEKTDERFFGCPIFCKLIHVTSWRTLSDRKPHDGINLTTGFNRKGRLKCGNGFQTPISGIVRESSRLFQDFLAWSSIKFTLMAWFRKKTAWMITCDHLCLVRRWSEFTKNPGFNSPGCGK